MTQRFAEGTGMTGVLAAVALYMKSSCTITPQALGQGVEEKRILFSFSAHKTHINFMPTRSSLAPFASELAAYKTGMDTLQLPYDKPLPRDLIRKIAEYRARDVRENGAL